MNPYAGFSFIFCCGHQMISQSRSFFVHCKKMRGMHGLYSVKAATTYYMGFKASQPSRSSRYCSFIGRQSFSTVPGPDLSPAYRSLEISEERILLLLALIQKKTHSTKIEAAEILELKRDLFLKHSVEDITAIVETFEKELSMTPKQLKIVFQLRRNLWKWSPGFLADTIGILKEEYHLCSKEIVRNITKATRPAPSILNPAILRDCAERKLIFESIYGKGCFDRVQQLRTTVSHQPSLLHIPLSLFYDRINHFLTLFGYSHPSELEWMLPASFLYNDLDYLERKTKLFYRYLTGGLELNSSKTNQERKPFVIPKEEYENHQKELEKKYPFLLDQPLEEIQDDVREVKKPRRRKSKSTTKMVITKPRSGENANKRIVEDEFLYESYRRYLSASEGTEKAGLYEDLVMNTILDYSERVTLDVMEEIDPVFMKEIEEKLFKEAQLPLEALYRELWKLSEHRKEENRFSPEKALHCIQHMEMTNVSFSYLLSKLGMLAIYSNDEIPHRFLVSSGFLRYSLEENLFPKLVAIGKPIQSYFQGIAMNLRKWTESEKELEEKRKDNNNSHNNDCRPLSTLSAKPGELQQNPPKSPDAILQECVDAYRTHPVRVELTRCFYFISNFSLNDIQRGMELFDELPVEVQEKNLFNLRTFIMKAISRRKEEQ
jgi:hypothetical protein